MVTEAVKTLDTETTLVSKMYKGIKRWALGSLALGTALLFLIFFNEFDLMMGFHGIVLIITGALSLKTRIPQMFRLYAVLVGGTAISNVISYFMTGDYRWSILCVVLLILWTVSLFSQYRKYRQLPLMDLYQSRNWPEKLMPPQEETIILCRFVKASLLITVFMFILFSTMCVGLVIYALVLTDSASWQSRMASLLPAYVFACSASIAIFSLALSTAAMVPENPKRYLAVLGVVLSSVILALNIVIESLVLA